jgi:hypothetical protein
MYGDRADLCSLLGRLSFRLLGLPTTGSRGDRRSPEAAARAEAEAAQGVAFAPTRSRSVLGALNDFAFNAEVRRTDPMRLVPGADVAEVGIRILVELDSLDMVPALDYSLGDAVHPIHHAPRAGQDDRVGQVSLLDEPEVFKDGAARRRAAVRRSQGAPEPRGTRRSRQSR